MDPRLIRANIALFQGKRAESQRLMEEYIVEQPDPQMTRREPMILWLTAQTQPRHAQRVEGLRGLVEQAPSDSPYARMAQSYLEDEAHYAGLLDAQKQRRPGLRPWQIVAGLVSIGVVLVAAVVLLSPPAPEPEVVIEETPEVTVAPTPTVIVQNTPVQFASGQPIQAEYDPLDGILTVLDYDPSVRYVVNNKDELVQPLEGTVFYGLQLEFRCLLPVCDNAPQADLFVALSDGSRIRPASDLFVAGEPPLAGGVGRGFTVTGWVVFQLPRSERPANLIVSQFPADGSDTRPPEITVALPQ